MRRDGDRRGKGDDVQAMPTLFRTANHYMASRDKEKGGTISGVHVKPFRPSLIYTPIHVADPLVPEDSGLCPIGLDYRYPSRTARAQHELMTKSGQSVPDKLVWAVT